MSRVWFVPATSRACSQAELFEGGRHEPGHGGAIHRFRDQLGLVIRRRGLLALVIAVVSQFAWVLVLVAGLRVVGIPEDVLSVAEIFAVYALVMEVTRQMVNGVHESKSDFLIRVMQHGSPRARLLKLADRISNLTALGYVHDAAFVRRYVEETRTFVLPYAKDVNPDMFRELSDLTDSRERSLPIVLGD